VLSEEPALWNGRHTEVVILHFIVESNGTSITLLEDDSVRFDNNRT
jgi:hypothetical protein